MVVMYERIVSKMDVESFAVVELLIVVAKVMIHTNHSLLYLLEELEMYYYYYSDSAAVVVVVVVAVVKTNRVVEDLTLLMDLI